VRRLGSAFIGGLLCLVVIVPATASAATISGTVTAEGGGPIAAVEVCPTPQPYTFEVDCTETDGAGHYALTELPGADYYLRFSGWRENLPYVDEFYDDAHDFDDADLAHVDALQTLTIDTALAAGGAIAGSVKDDGTEAPIAGIRACAIDHEGGTERCGISDAGGAYVINGLPSGKYDVEFEGSNQVSYLHEFYENAATWAEATDVEVTAPATVTGIDDELAPGAGISGHVTDPATGAPAKGVFVCAEEPPPREQQGCAYTDEAGSYAIASLPAGTYVVAFELEYFPWGHWAEEWWNEAATMEEADPIELAPPEMRTGIDGHASGPAWQQEPESEAEPEAQPPTVLLPPVTLPVPPHRRALKCKKGFHKKKVHGKVRCVKKPKHRHPRHER
jgi:hypothetical protein